MQLAILQRRDLHVPRRSQSKPHHPASQRIVLPKVSKNDDRLASFRQLPYKAAFYLKDLPNTAPTNGLPEVLATMCLNARQQPLNPHKQRLLSAAARVAKVDPGAGAKPKETKAKGKAKAASKKPKDTSQVKVTSKTDSDEYQKAYSDAKKSFMDGFLVWFGNM